MTLHNFTHLWRADVSIPAQTALATAAAAVSPGQTVSFSAGAVPQGLTQQNPTPWPADPGVGEGVQWIVRALRHENNFYFTAKRPGPSTALYLIAGVDGPSSVTWTCPWYDWVGDLGHPYDGQAIDPSTGKFYFHRYNAGIFSRWDNGTWTEVVPSPLISADDNGGTQEAVGIAIHPALWGPGEPGFIMNGTHSIHAMRLSDQYDQKISDYVGALNAVACYSPYHDCIFTGGGSASNDLYRVDPGNPPTVSFVSTVTGITDLRSSHHYSAAAGGVHVLGSNLYVITPGGYVKSTDNGSTWSALTADPFSTQKENRLFITCQDEGVFWMLAHPEISELWRPS